MPERRQLKRHHLIFYLRVFIQETNELIGFVVDISQEGLLIVSEIPFESGKIYKLQMSLSPEEGNKMSLHFTAECRWSRIAANPDLHEAGFLLLDFRPLDITLIDDLIDDIGFRE